MSKDKTTIRVNSKNGEGDKKTVFVKKPSAHQLQEAQLASNTAFRKALDSGALTREKIDDYMREQGMWDDTKQKNLEGLSLTIINGERQLARGGRTADGEQFGKKQAKQLALEMRDARSEQMLLLGKQRELDRYTVQGQADNARFNFLVSVCTLDEEGNIVFDNMDDYLTKSDEPYALEAASELGNIMYGLDRDYEKNRVENKFLVEYGFAREKDAHLVNEKGQLIDSFGRRVNEDGRYINDDNEFINANGERVDKDGNPVEKFVPFEDEVPTKAKRKVKSKSTETVE